MATKLRRPDGTYWKVPNYREWVGLLTQTGTNAPVATVLENDNFGTIVWARTGAGEYTGTATGKFTANKTTVEIVNTSGANVANVKFAGRRVDNNTIKIESGSGAAFADDLLTGVLVKIRVYI